LNPPFVQDDAFTFSPLDARPGRPGAPVDWLVSDVIAFPERVAPLLQAWCGGRWARVGLVVTMKFKGTEPNLAALAAALDAAEALGYVARAKHFFSNKNEVTIMLAPGAPGAGGGENGWEGGSEDG
jgi:23S rRNA C2498 (ribose-2'-O)-methylase RlmM